MSRLLLLVSWLWLWFLLKKSPLRSGLSHRGTTLFAFTSLSLDWLVVGEGEDAEQPDNNERILSVACAVVNKNRWQDSCSTLLN